MAMAASNGEAMTKEEENRGVDLLFFPVSSALRWTINVIAQFSATTIAIDDDWHAIDGAPAVIARKVPWKDGGDDGGNWCVFFGVLRGQKK